MGRRIHILLVVAALTTGCPSEDDAAKDPTVMYREALENLLDEDYLEAATKFETVANTTLNPVLTQTATVRLADSLFFQGKYAEAAEVYREFETQYPKSPDVPHAAYMRGVCHTRKMPEDVWLLPPAESREMEDVRSAYEAFAFIVDIYPRSYFSLRARAALQDIVLRNCRHDLYVAAYYRKQDNPKAVVQRLEEALALEERERTLKHVAQSFTCATSRSNILTLARSAAESNDPKALERAEALYRKSMDSFEDAGEGLAEILKLKGAPD